MLIAALNETMEKAFDAFFVNDAQAATLVEPWEETIDQLIDEIRTRHIERLQSGRCTIQLCFVLSDLLTNMERVSDHCSNLAICIIEAAQGQLNAHAYLHELKGRGSFNRHLQQDLAKYTLHEG